MVNKYKQKIKEITLFRLCLLPMLFLMLSADLIAQNKIVSGQVISEEDGESIPGVTVLIMGTAIGTVTDINGKYSIDLGAAENPILTYSFVGYVSKEINVGNRSVVDVELSFDVTSLDEVVVVGYGVQKKKLNTGANAQVKGDALLKLSNTSALEAMQGQVAGVNITATSGQPGEDMRVTIRGLGSISGSGPLFVVDGIQTGDISYLNNSDIESIDVLKDAASAAIYGSQASNGVVLITTKTGSAGEAKISFDSYYGIQNPVRQISMLNSREYAVIANEAAINSGKLPHFTTDEINAMGEGTDWVDEMIYDNAVTQNYSLGLTGGNETSIYSLSMSYTGQEGMMGGPDVSEFDRYAFRVNTEHNFLGDRVKIGQHLTFSYLRKNGIDVGNQYNNSLRSAFNTSPFLPMYDDNGNFLNNSDDPNDGVMYNGELWSPWAVGESNPYATMLLTNQNDNNNQKILGDVYLEVNPIKNLKLRTRLGVDFYTSENRSFQPQYELSVFNNRVNDEASQSLSKGLALTWDNVITYDLKVNDHSITVLGGTSAYVNNGSFVNVSNSGLILSDLNHAYIDNATNTDLTTLSYGGGPFDEFKLQSYFGRVNYDFKEKYLLNATFRTDGSSNFSKDNRWGYFPSVSAGWIVSNESFLGGMNDVVSFFKLRASWGQVGNQSVPAYQYLAPVDIGVTNYYFGSEDFNAAANAVGAYPSRLANPDLKWETSEQIDIGFDAHLLNSHLDVSFDWYDKTTKDWLLPKPGFATDGTDAPFFNGGDVKNTGIELALTYRNSFGNFNYYVSATGAKNKNEVTSVPTEDGIVHGGTNQLYDNSTEFYRRAEEGYPIGYFWGWETDGIFQNEAEVAAHRNSTTESLIQPNAQPGDLRYVDLNNDGIINDEDKKMVGDPNPDYTFSLSFGFDYKSFDFSMLAYGVAGNQIVQSYRNHVSASANYTPAILGRWHGEGTSNTVPRVTEGNTNYLFSDIFIQDGDFLRINNVTIGYDFANLVSIRRISRLRLYASVQNALTFTKYDGLDPEVGFGFNEDDRPDGSSGVDLGYYPRPRTFLIGLNVNF